MILIAASSEVGWIAPAGIMEQPSKCWNNIAFIATILLVMIQSVIGQADSSKLCLAANEPIYTPGEDHVQAPRLRIERGPLEKPLKSSSRAVFEVVINSAGTICEIRALKAPDRETAQQLAEVISDNFRFRPATRRGKPVAARFKVIFNVQGKVETE